jgi:hypothetical protein
MPARAGGNTSPACRKQFEGNGKPARLGKHGTETGDTKRKHILFRKVTAFVKRIATTGRLNRAVRGSPDSQT